MSAQNHSINMTNGSIVKNVIRFVVPLILGNILQLLYNAADIIVVSRWAGSRAMASVGATSTINSLIVNLCIGLSVGSSVVVSRCFGAKDEEGIKRSIHSTMLLGIVSGIITMIIGLFVAKPLLMLLGTPAGDVFEGALLYMRIYFAAAVATMVYNFGASVLRAQGDTKRPLYILSAAGIVNVILNLIFVIKFQMGVAGVAVATAVASVLSAASVLVILTRQTGAGKLYIRKMRFYKKELTESLKIGIPAGIQSSVFSIANAAIQSAVNSFGTAAIAGSAASSNIEGFVYTAMNAFYQATLTSVSQNYGAKDEKRVYRSIKVCILSVAVVGGVLGSLTCVFARQLMSIYITDSPQAIEFGLIKTFYVGLPYFLCGIMEVLAGALRGIGHSNIGMFNSLLGACGVRLLWVAFILPLNHTPQTLFICWPISWVIVIVMHLVSFKLVRKKSILLMMR